MLTNMNYKEVDQNILIIIISAIDFSNKNRLRLYIDVKWIYLKTSVVNNNYIYLCCGHIIYYSKG